MFQLEIPELQAFHGKIELGPEIIIMALRLGYFELFLELYGENAALWFVAICSDLHLLMIFFHSGCHGRSERAYLRWKRSEDHY